MRVDIRSAVTTVLYTTFKYQNRTIISWNDLTRYIELLEKEYETKFEIVDIDCVDRKKYDKNVICKVVTHENIYFAINPEIYPDEFDYSIVDETLFLNEENTKKFINPNYNKQEINDAKILSMSDYRDTYLINIDTLDDFLGEKPQEHIFFEEFVAIYALEYLRLYGNVIDKEQFWKDINVMDKFLKSRKINLINANNFGLFKFTCKYSEYIEVKGNEFLIHIDNVSEYTDKITNNIDCNTYMYIKKLITTYIIDELLNPELVYQKTKDIK